MNDDPSVSNNEREGLRWYRQGMRDGATASKNAAAGDHEVACFLFQQGAEKLLKSVVLLGGERGALGHSTVKLFERCREYFPEFPDVIDSCRELDVFYIPTRYPNGVPDGAPYEFFSSTHSARGGVAYRRVAAAVEPLFAPIVVKELGTGRESQTEPPESQRPADTEADDSRPATNNDSD